MELIKTSGVVLPGGEPLHVGLVQTAYANGNSTLHVKNVLNIPVVFTQTGVKHLHHVAEEFDVGVYFEANGHGTVLFSKRAIKAFQTFKGETDASKVALQRLVGFSDLINQTVGRSEERRVGKECSS